MSDPLLELFRRNSRVNEFFLDHLSDEDLALSDGKGGDTIFQLLSHMASSRGGWLLNMGMSPDHAADIRKLAGGMNLWEWQAKDLPELRAMFAASDDAAVTAVRDHRKSGQSFADPYVAGTFPDHPDYFLHYMMIHDANHRGQISALLRQNGWSREQLDALEAHWDIWRE